MTFQDHLQFYLTNKISPVRQDISDIQRHLERRQSLYRRLGLPRQFITGKSVLEVGPGSGHNSLYVAACLPTKLNLVEPNPVGREGIAELYHQFDPPHTSPLIIAESLETLNQDQEYDIAIAEAWLGSTDHEISLIKKLSAMVRPGGILILTLQSPVGMLANVLRRLLTYELVSEEVNIASKTRILMTAFSTHLHSMPAMSRLHEDWIQDNLLNPAALTGVLTPAVLLHTLPNFDVYETYPRIMTDWRWYKELTGAERSLNPVLIQCWQDQTHNFLNTHSPVTHQSAHGDFNNKIESASNKLINYLIECETRGLTPDKQKCLLIVNNIYELLAGANNQDANAIAEFIAIYEKNRIQATEVATMKLFGQVFGRELVYISLIREY